MVSSPAILPTLQVHLRIKKRSHPQILQKTNLEKFSPEIVSETGKLLTKLFSYAKPMNAFTCDDVEFQLLCRTQWMNWRTYWVIRTSRIGIGTPRWAIKQGKKCRLQRNPWMLSSVPRHGADFMRSCAVFLFSQMKLFRTENWILSTSVKHLELL